LTFGHGLLRDFFILVDPNRADPPRVASRQSWAKSLG
jgi:hypothetical protein